MLVAESRYATDGIDRKSLSWAAPASAAKASAGGSDHECQERKLEPMISEDVVLGEGVQIFQRDLVNLYGCRIGDGTRIGAFVEIQKGASVGANCKVSSHTFVCEGVDIEDGVFIGHGVMFTNDIYPRAVTEAGSLQGASDWKVVRTLVRRRASIGSNATVLAGV